VAVGKRLLDDMAAYKVRSAQDKKFHIVDQLVTLPAQVTIARNTICHIGRKARL
jgi:hypothetical protein